MERKFDEKSDVWSFGVTMWEVFSYGETPKLGELKQLVKLLHDGTRLQKPAACPIEVYNIYYYGCWEYCRENRKSFAEIRDQLKAKIEDRQSEVAARAAANE